MDIFRMVRDVKNVPLMKSIAPNNCFYSGVIYIPQGQSSLGDEGDRGWQAVDFWDFWAAVMTACFLSLSMKTEAERHY